MWMKTPDVIANNHIEGPAVNEVTIKHVIKLIVPFNAFMRTAPK